MDLDAIKTFIEVMRAGSFAAVARKRDIDPSSISRLIAQLEDQLGFRLFQRTTRKLVATEAGALYFERIEPILEDIARAQNEARDIVSEPAGLVRMTASMAFGTGQIVPLLPRLRALYPKLELELILSDLVMDLIADRIDLAIRLGPRLDTGLIGLKLMPTRYHVCASPAYIAQSDKLKKPADLETHSCLLFSLSGYRHAWRFRKTSGEISEVPVKGGFVMSNALALREAAMQGLGPVLLADWLVGEDLREGRLVDLFPAYEVTATDFETAAWLLYPSRAYLPQKVRAMIDFLKMEIGKQR